MATATATAVLVERFSDNILAVIKSASADEIEEGFSWYDTAKATLARMARQYDVPLPTAVGVASAESPQVPWHQNVRAAELTLQAYVAGAPMPKVSGYLSNRRKAWRLLKAMPATANDMLAWFDDKPVGYGIKTHNFAANIIAVKDEFAVTVDGHAHNIAVHGMRRESIRAVKMTADSYLAAMDAYRAVADQLGMLPKQAQAIAWLVYRNLDLAK